jgi:hypothetical protein
MAHRAQEQGRFSPWAATWRLGAEQSDGPGLSVASREALRCLWEAESNPEWLRRFAFSHWGKENDDPSLIRLIPSSDPLFEDAVWQRARLGDKEVVPNVVKNLKTNRRWLLVVPAVWAPEFEGPIDAALAQLGADQSLCEKPWADAYFFMAHLLRDIPPDPAEQFLRKHWPVLSDIPLFVQVALYLGTEPLVSLAAERLQESDPASEPFSHIDSFFGFFTRGLMDRVEVRHLEVLRPYLHRVSDHCVERMVRYCQRREQWDWAIQYLQPECRRRLATAQPEPDGRQPFIASVATRWFPTDHEVLLELDEIERESPDRRHGGVWFWWERAIERKETAHSAMQLLKRWLDNAPSLTRLQIVGLAIRDRGTRADLAIFRGCPIATMLDEAKTILASAEYAVMRRTLE